MESEIREARSVPRFRVFIPTVMNLKRCASICPRGSKGLVARWSFGFSRLMFFEVVAVVRGCLSYSASRESGLMEVYCIY